MLKFALAFFVVAIVAAALGFGGISAAAVSIAQILCFVFLACFAIFLMRRGWRRPAPISASTAVAGRPSFTRVRRSYARRLRELIRHP